MTFVSILTVLSIHISGTQLRFIAVVDSMIPFSRFWLALCPYSTSGITFVLIIKIVTHIHYDDFFLTTKKHFLPTANFIQSFSQ